MARAEVHPAKVCAACHIKSQKLHLYALQRLGHLPLKELLRWAACSKEER